MLLRGSRIAPNPSLEERIAWFTTSSRRQIKEEHWPVAEITIEKGVIISQSELYKGIYEVEDLVDRDGRRKITVSGDEEVVDAFLTTWAPKQGLVNLYGDPARGFAGGYLPE